MTFDAVGFQLLERDDARRVERSDARPAELREIPAYAQRFADVARDGADVRPAPAVDPHPQQRPIVVEQFDAVDANGARRKFDRLAGPRQLVGTSPAHLHRAERWRTLLDVADETCEDDLNFLATFRCRHIARPMGRAK